MNKLKIALYYGFHPSTIIKICFNSMILFNTILYFILNYARNPKSYSFIVSLITGITASALVAIVLEISNNISKNKRAGSALFDYDKHLAIYYAKTANSIVELPNNRKKRTAHIKQIWTNDLPKVLFALPTLVPILEETYKNNSDYLSFKEHQTIEKILFCYNDIVNYFSVLGFYKKYSYPFNATPDCSTLSSLIPDQILKYESQNVIKKLSTEELYRKLNKYVIRLLQDYPEWFSQNNIELSEEKASTFGKRMPSNDEEFLECVISNNLLEINKFVQTLVIEALRNPCNKIVFDGASDLNYLYGQRLFKKDN